MPQFKNRTRTLSSVMAIIQKHSLHAVDQDSPVPRCINGAIAKVGPNRMHVISDLHLAHPHASIVEDNYVIRAGRTYDETAGKAMNVNGKTISRYTRIYDVTLALRRMIAEPSFD
jgi:hypothetical protein